MTQLGRNDSEAISDEALMERLARGGETEVLATLMDRYTRRLYAVSRRYLRDDGEIEDVTQETWLAVFKERRRYRRGAPFSPWLYTVHLNRCRDRLRATGRLKRQAPIAEGAEVEAAADRSSATAEEQVLDAQRRELVLSALDRLPARQREVLALSLVEGLTYEEVARRLDCPAGTVRSNLHYAVRRLRKIVGRREERS